MSRTTRAHLPTDKYAERARTRRKLRTLEQIKGKSHKRVRVNDKANLRQEYR